MTESLAPLQAALQDRYALERELGRGGMATVWLARDLKHDRLVAVKVLRPELTPLLGAERFLREIRVTARLRHPHLLTLIDSGEAAGFLYYVMPYVPGESLRARLTREGQLPLEEVRRLTAALASALQHAHDQGVVHRDIKPENILLYEGEPMVTDFGIALAMSAAGSGRLTESGLFLGTPAYMSPEQATAEPRLDGRSDQYSLACVVFEMLAGEPPYSGPTVQSIITKRLSAPVPSLRHARPGVPDAVNDVVRRAMALVPADRFPSIAGFAKALAAARRPAPPPPALARRAAWALAAGGITVALLLAGSRWFADPARATARLDPSLVVVAPLENRTGDPALEPFGLMAADWVTQQLTGTDIIRVVDAQSMLLAARQSEHDAPDVRLRALAEQTGAGTVVVGGYYKDGDSLRAQVRVIDARSGAVRTALSPVAGPLARPTALLEVLRARVTGALAALLDERLTTWKVASATPPTFDSYREFLIAMQFHFRYDEEHALPHFERAAALDTTFWQAHLWTGMEYGNLMQVDRMDSTFRRVERFRAWLSPYDQANLDYFNRSFVWGHWNEGHDAALRMARLAPDAAHPLYAIARTALALNRPREAVAAMSRMDRARGWGQAATYTYRFLAAASHMVGDESGQRRAALAAPEDVGPASVWVTTTFTAGILLSKAGGVTLTDLDNPVVVIQRLDSLARVWQGAGPPPGLIGRAAAAEARYHNFVRTADTVALWTLAWFARHPPAAEARRTFLTQHALLDGEASRAAEGLKLAEAVLRESPDSLDALTAVGILQARLGRAEQAHRIARTIAGRPGRDWLGLRRYRQACIAAQLGEADAAFSLLEEARGLGLEVWALHADPNMEPLWQDERFRALVRPRG
jgi:TolB-like protein